MSGRRSRREAQRIRRRVLTVVLILVPVILFFAVFRLRTVIVSGNTHNVPSEITELVLERPVLGNTVLAWLMNTGRKISSAGFVDRLHVSILGIDRIRVSVVERRFAGRVFEDGKWYYFDTGGEVLAEAENALEGDGIPPVEGLSFTTSVEVMKQLPITNGKVFSMLGMLLNRTEVMEEMIPDRVVFGADSSMSLIYGDVTVLLGSGEKLEMRLRELSGVLKELLSGYRGTLHLENYDGSQNGLVFDPM